MNDLDKHDSLDALLDGWCEPVVRPDFTRSVVMNLPEQEVVPETGAGSDSSSKILVLPNFFGPSTLMGAAAAVLLLLVIALTHTSRIAMESDLVELEGYSDDAVSELYRLIHLEGLAGSDDLSPEDADTALLLFATGG